MPSHIWSSFTNITNNRDLELKLEMLENTSEKELENYGMDGGGVNYNYVQLLDFWNQPVKFWIFGRNQGGVGVNTEERRTMELCKAMAFVTNLSQF